MWYRKNVPGWEGWIRIALGVAMVAWGIFLFQTARGGISLAVGGVALALTGFVGFCPLCKLVGRKPLDPA